MTPQHSPSDWRPAEDGPAELHHTGWLLRFWITCGTPACRGRSRSTAAPRDTSSRGWGVGAFPSQSNAVDNAFPLVPIHRTPPRHAVGVPVPEGTVVSQISGNDQRRNRPFSGDRIIGVVVGCALLRANVGRSCR